MDQQLDQYGKWIRDTWGKVKSSVLVGLTKRHKIILVIISLLLVWVCIEELYYTFRFIPVAFGVVPGFEQEGMAEIWVMIYAVSDLVFPLMTLAGLVYLMLGKSRGWIFVLNFFSYMIVWRVSSLISIIALPHPMLNNPLVNNVDSVLFQWVGDLILWIVVYALCFGYFFSKPIKLHFDIKRKQVLSSFGITAIFLLFESIVSVISVVNG